MRSPARGHATLLPIAALVLACSSSAPLRQSPTTNAGGAGSRSGGDGGTGRPAPDDGGISIPDAPVGDAVACTPVTCSPAGGRYCGKIGDGCQGTLDCPETCADGETCGGAGEAQVCGRTPDPNCKPATCDSPGGRLCGRVGDGCGRALACGDCPGGGVCGAVTAQICGAPGSAVAGCTNLCKRQVQCAGGGTTRLSGVVLTGTTARFGTADPLYNAVVYVPNAALEPFAPGVACERCGTQISGRPLATTLSAADGRFTLENVPAGKDVPLVIQIGRWRRRVTIPEVLPCQDNPLPIELTRMPRNQSEGDIPLIGIATGKWDPLECLLRKMGLDDSEFTLPTGNGRVHLYAYEGLTLGPGTPKGDALTGSLPALSRYDVVLLPCDNYDKKPAAAEKNLADYTAKGGRLFLTDWAHAWLKDGGAFESAALWNDFLPQLGEDFGALVDQSFPKGKALAQWLEAVHAADAAGQVKVHDPYGGFAWYEKLTPPTQRWLYTSTPEVAEIFSFNTPVGAPAAEQCGRVAYSTFHVVDERNGNVFPAGCTTTPLTPQEKVLEFMLFDVASCVQPDKDAPTVFRPPVPPPPPPPPVIR